ncbi:hypothetical protein BN1708_019277, partial [Verticillium longisporum]
LGRPRCRHDRRSPPPQVQRSRSRHSRR